jgi:hypothetical protein
VNKSLKARNSLREESRGTLPKMGNLNKSPSFSTNAPIYQAVHKSPRHSSIWIERTLRGNAARVIFKGSGTPVIYNRRNWGMNIFAE